MGGAYSPPPTPVQAFRNTDRIFGINQDELNLRVKLAEAMDGFSPTPGARIIAITRRVPGNVKSDAIVSYQTSSGSLGQLSEPDHVFPSEHLVAQLMLVL